MTFYRKFNIVVSALTGLLSLSAHAAESAAGSAGGSPASPAAKPNIVYILADDLGYGDVQCLNPKHGKIKTPNIDKLAAQGMTFTDAHGSSSVCTPSRYSILTGRYNWRTRLQHYVLANDSPPLIAANRLTVPSMLKQQGYDTAIVGKWHLGWTWPWDKGGKNDYTLPIGDGPITRGFDWYFGTPFDPGVFMENDRIIGTPVPAPKGKYLYAKTAVPGWTDESMLPTFTEKVTGYIEGQAKSKQPFFMFYAMTSPHTPLVPNKEWQGKSGLGRYADFVMETDAMIGKVLASIERSGIADNTLVIFASDNGCAPYMGITAGLEKQGHYPSAQFRGYKADAWDGGHRIPFIVRWPGVVKPGAACAQLVCQMDLLATCAEIHGVKLPESAAEDSVSLLPLLKGGDQPVRDALVHHSIDGNFAIREGKWKLVCCPGSGGWAPPPKVAKGEKPPGVQLYDMAADEGEQHNLQAQHPEIVARLTAKLEKIVADGRSTPGPKQKNDVPVDIYKKGK